MMDAIPGAWSRTPADLLAEIVMAATNHDGPFLVVEGPTDQRFLELKVDAAVYFVQAGGKSTCITLIRLLNSAARPFYYIGIVDEDYDWITPEREGNLVLTDTRDLEGILVRSTALDSVILELADKARVANFLQRSGTSIREALLKRAIFFGRIRTLGFIHGSICLEKIKPARFCNQDWSYDEAACAEVCVELGLSDSTESLLSAANSLDAPSDWHFARGHDLIDILVGGFVKIFSGNAPPRTHVEALLRQSMQKEEFVATKLFKRVSQWETESNQRIWKVA
ncbi:DUF4435 domain-containing protein [Xanthomonas euvesicatoria]|uniref:DUF4435 domain-containing protein n=1 Tax=Xanthomonas euvesicatoria TaxID=456327 RepID=UPI001C47C5B2|nr:DUF4435 domain-containing protein [Xanthomonas euvesicatoria]MBV6830331.1 DUF4435 domain-containing protein [Xanthomonas campestris pv. viegasii]